MLLFTTPPCLCCNRTQPCVPQVYGTQSVCDFLRANQPWKQYLQGGNYELMPPLVPGQQVQLSSALSVVPAAVPHRAEFSDAVGFYVLVRRAGTALRSRQR